MTYAQDESSVQSSQPIELYQITTPQKTYYLTSYAANFSWNGNTYLAAAGLTRNNLVVPEVGQKRDLVVEIALTESLAQDLLIAGIPQRDVQVALYRYQQVSNTVFGPMWAGYVSELDSDGVSVRMTVPSRLSEFLDRVSLPIAQLSRLCQHSLYDAGCTMQQTGVKQTINGPGGAFQIATTVAGLPGTTVYNLASVDGLQDGGPSITKPLLYGFIRRLADGETRSIVAQANTTIQTDYPFRVMNVGDAVTVNVGCDRTTQTCRDKFNNIANHGGHPFLVPNNPQLPSGYGVVISVGQP